MLLFIGFKLPSFVFTEDYQAELMMEHHKVFDKFRNSFLVGEMVWNFADFMTTQSEFSYIVMVDCSFD